MKSEDYAAAVPFHYPGTLSEERRDEVDNLRVPIRDLTSDDLIYSMSRQIESNFQTIYSVAEQLVGEDAAKEIAYQVGLRYGGAGYRKVLEANDAAGGGSPRTMALYQDLAHYIRGPKHTSALFAEYDDERCIVRRKECLYYSDAAPSNGKYTGEFERGACDGYASVDPNLDRTEVHACRWRGDGHCEMHWVFKRGAAPERGFGSSVASA